MEYLMTIEEVVEYINAELDRLNENVKHLEGADLVLAMSKQQALTSLLWKINPPAYTREVFYLYDNTAVMYTGNQAT